VLKKAKHDRYIRFGMEKDRTLKAICLLHDMAPCEVPSVSQRLQ
jgi:hypothetical protein